MRACIDIILDPLGNVHLDSIGDPVFPGATGAPGVYRFRFTRGEWRGTYVGEAETMNRRFQQYRTPGVKQPTNIRIHDLIIATLNAGGGVSVDAAYQGTLVIDGADVMLDMTSKAARVLAESALLADAVARRHSEILNL
jgi:hypothetical protein